MLRSLETMEGQANFLAEWQAAGSWRLGFDYLAQLLALEPQQVKKVAQQYLTPDRASIVVYRPQGEPALAESATEARSWLAA
jgi:zinc protease